MSAIRLTAQTLAVLAVMLSDAAGEWYGLELSDACGLKPGTIYPILDRMLRAGWVERRWEEIDPSIEGRPRRRLYRLTGAGETAARSALTRHVAVLEPGLRTGGVVPRTPRIA